MLDTDGHGCCAGTAGTMTHCYTALERQSAGNGNGWPLGTGTLLDAGELLHLCCYRLEQCWINLGTS